MNIIALIFASVVLSTVSANQDTDQMSCDFRKGDQCYFLLDMGVAGWTFTKNGIEPNGDYGQFTFPGPLEIYHPYCITVIYKLPIGSTFTISSMDPEDSNINFNVTGDGSGEWKTSQIDTTFYDDAVLWLGLERDHDGLTALQQIKTRDGNC